MKETKPVKSIVDTVSETGKISLRFSRAIVLDLGQEKRRRLSEEQVFSEDEKK